MITAERLFVALALLGVGVLVADAIGSMSLRELLIFDCRIKGGLDVCAFSWRRLVFVMGDVGLTLLTMIFVCNARHLRNMKAEVSRP